jgi:hypothetical protein
MPELRESPAEFQNQMKLIRVFSFDGIELHDSDDLGSMMKNGDYLFYSISNLFLILDIDHLFR